LADSLFGLSLSPFKEPRAVLNCTRYCTPPGNIPLFVRVTEAGVHEVYLDDLVPEAGAIYIMDRGYLDFDRLYALHQEASFLVGREKPIHAFESFILPQWIKHPV